MVSNTEMKEVEALKESLLKMWRLVEERIGDAIQSLTKKDSQLAQRVIDRDDEVDRFENSIDEMCLKLLGMKKLPTADLRLITMAMKIVTDLERMGDHAVNIARRAIPLNEAPQLKPYVDLPRMAEIALSMARDVLNAFLNRDVQLAHAVHTRDDLVDALNDQMFRELITYTMADPSATERAIHLEIVGRYLERIADHATNIAEDIIFIETGEVMKHQPRVREIPLKGSTP